MRPRAVIDLESNIAVLDQVPHTLREGRHDVRRHTRAAAGTIDVAEDAGSRRITSCR